MRYGIDDKPGAVPMALYGLQWWVVFLPVVVITGVVLARLHFPDAASQIFYVQKLFVVTGAVVAAQMAWGHRLPLVSGPAAILLVGLTAGHAGGYDATYSAIAIGGAALALLGASGALRRVLGLFTPRIVAVILALIAMTLSPVILRLLTEGGGHFSHVLFAMAFVAVLAYCNHALPGAWKSLTVIIGLVGGTLAAGALDGFPALAAQPLLPAGAAPAPRLFIHFQFHAGAVLSFLFCFLALLINELGSAEALGHILGAPGMPGRVRRGVAVQGLASVAAGSLGVIGSVDYSYSSGVVVATGNASRYTMLPAAAGLVLCGFSPTAVGLLALIPGVVMGSLLLFFMSSQLSAALNILAQGQAIGGFEHGLTVALPIMVALLVSFAPPATFAPVPQLVRPIAANGFVMGTITVLALEHLVFRAKAR